MNSAFTWGGHHNQDGTWGFGEKCPGWPMPVHRLLVKRAPIEIDGQPQDNVQVLARALPRHPQQEHKPHAQPHWMFTVKLPTSPSC